MSLSNMNEKEKTFVKTVKQFYTKNGRHDLPWRQTTDPYKILVSEIMLQQTQVPRVIEKYKEFLKAFPTVKKLAIASQSDVLKLWSGLGYNRRARFLHQCAKEIVILKKFPVEVTELEKLPGIGHYTARAVATFAYNQPHVFIETNIRTVFVHHFFPKKEQVPDSDILILVTKTLDTKNPRAWYGALMDYGTYLKSQGIKTHRQAKAYAKQSSFIGSNRRVRGLIMKALLEESRTIDDLSVQTDCTHEELLRALDSLVKDIFVVKKGKKYALN
jgi:A/G-specific adenine glycosylase